MTDAKSAASPPRPIELFYAYSHKDEALRDELETHLSILKRRGVISGWHDRRISAGTEWTEEISDHLNRADLILLLVSADFIASDYCYDREMTRAMERHQSREARVIPVILRDCDWDFEPLSKLHALPRDGRPVSVWASRDEAFKNVALGIKKVAEELGRTTPKPRKEHHIDSVSSTEYVKTRKRVSPSRNTRDLLLYGPRLKVEVGPPILRGGVERPPTTSESSSRSRFLRLDALLDPGAARTVLTSDVVRRAGLTKISQTTLKVVGGVIKADVYAASLRFPPGDLSTIEVIEVFCCDLNYPLYHCLLGRDVLSRWTFIYDGPVGTWEISEAAVKSWVEPPEGSDLWASEDE